MAVFAVPKVTVGIKLTERWKLELIPKWSNSRVEGMLFDSGFYLSYKILHKIHAFNIISRCTSG